MTENKNKKDKTSNGRNQTLVLLRNHFKNNLYFWFGRDIFNPNPDYAPAVGWWIKVLIVFETKNHQVGGWRDG